MVSPTTNVWCYIGYHYAKVNINKVNGLCSKHTCSRTLKHLTPWSNCIHAAHLALTQTPGPQLVNPEASHLLSLARRPHPPATARQQNVMPSPSSFQTPISSLLHQVCWNKPLPKADTSGRTPLGQGAELDPEGNYFGNEILCFCGALVPHAMFAESVSVVRETQFSCCFIIIILFKTDYYGVSQYYWKWSCWVCEIDCSKQCNELKSSESFSCG